MRPAKLLLLLATASFILFSSCKKKFTCVCAGGFTGKYREETTITGMKKKDAKTFCQAKGDSVVNPDGIMCDLK